MHDREQILKEHDVGVEDWNRNERQPRLTDRDGDRTEGNRTQHDQHSPVPPGEANVVCVFFLGQVIRIVVPELLVVNEGMRGKGKSQERENRTVQNVFVKQPLDDGREDHGNCNERDRQ